MGIFAPLYSEERVSNIFKISEPLQSYNGLEIYDVLTSFKGDSPAHQFEAGHQKGGELLLYSMSNLR